MKGVSNWFQANKLSVNASKTNYMLLATPHMTGKRQDAINVILDNTQLDRVKTTEFLGVIIDENFTRKKQKKLNHYDTTLLKVMMYLFGEVLTNVS